MPSRSATGPSCSGKSRRVTGSWRMPSPCVDADLRDAAPIGEVTLTPNMRVALRLSLVLLLCVAQPALAQPSHEVVIQETIVRSNAAQSLAVAARDLAAIGDEADGAYYQRLLRGTQALIDDGATSVELVNIEWGPI